MLFEALRNLLPRHRRKVREAREYAAAIRTARGELEGIVDRRAPDVMERGDLAFLVNELVERHVAPLVRRWDDYPEPQNALTTAKTLLTLAATRAAKEGSPGSPNAQERE